MNSSCLQDIYLFLTIVVQQKFLHQQFYQHSKRNFQKLDNPTIILNQCYLSIDLIVTSVYNAIYNIPGVHARTCTPGN